MITSEQLRDAFKYLFPDELPALKRYAQMLPDNPVVINIGAGAGTSGLAFMESRPDLILVTVDTHDADSPFGCLYAERQTMVEAGLGDAGRWRQIHGDSKEVGRYWMDWPHALHVDLVFIDGDHSYEGCKGDIDAWVPNLKPGGYLLIHDYNKTEVIANMKYDPATMPRYRAWEGVNQAVDELMDDQRVDFVEVVDTLAVFQKKLLPA